MVAVLRNKSRFWVIITFIELLVAGLIILLDLFVPTLLILALIAVSLLVRKESIVSLGFRKFDWRLRTLVTIFLFSIGWSLFHLFLTMPTLNHLTGTTQDLSAFVDLKGNTGKLVILLVVSWTLAAFGEEIVYRGYLQKRVIDLFGSTTTGIITAIGFSSLLFGIAHTEQGVIGVVLTFLDALFFSWLKLRYNNTWAAVLGHGFNNTVGLITFYFVGPLYGFW